MANDDRGQYKPVYYYSFPRNVNETTQSEELIVSNDDSESEMYPPRATRKCFQCGNHIPHSEAGRHNKLLHPWPAKRPRLLNTVTDSPNAEPSFGLQFDKGKTDSMQGRAPDSRGDLKSTHTPFPFLPNDPSSFAVTACARSVVIYPESRNAMAAAMPNTPTACPRNLGSFSSFQSIPANANGCCNFPLTMDQRTPPGSTRSLFNPNAKQPVAQDDWKEALGSPKTCLEDLLNHRLRNYIGTDFIVHIGDMMYPCHKFVLEAYCVFFRDKIHLHEYRLPEDRVSPKAFQIVYEWMLNKERLCAELGALNVCDVLSASLYLGIEDLIVQCHHIIYGQK